MNRQDTHRFVQQYVERQKAYLTTYTTVEHLLNERHGTPSKPRLRSDEFGFETPVLHPRVPENAKAAQSQLTVQVGRSKSRTHGVEPGAPPNQGPGPLGKASSEIQHPTQGKKDKPKSKRKKASSPIDTDNERTARLADRRERKRKKRAIVNPPQKHDEDIVPTAAPKKGRANGQKAKKPAALALLYGFSATNVTKDRLTLKPAPSIGVFSKGRASAKKKVTATRKHSSGNEFFSESAFLNKPSERVADQSKTDDDSDDSSVSSISNHPIPKDTRATNRTKKARGTETPVVNTPQASTRTAAESEVWDIELHSKLPSSACDVSSEPGAKDSTPVILDLRGAEWAVSIKEHPERRNKTRTPSLSVIQGRTGHSVVCGSLPAISDKRDELSIPHAVDAPSIHPSHSASQVGRRAVDTRPSDWLLVASKYFIEPEQTPVQGLAADSLQTSRSNDGIDVLGSQISGQDAEGATLDIQTIHRVASPLNSLISVPQPMVEFQTRYDIAPLEFPSDVSLYDDCYARVDVPWEPLEGTCRDYLASSVVETQCDRSDISAMEHHHPHQCTTWDSCRPWSADLATGDVEGVPVPAEDFESPYDPLALECDDLGAQGSGFEPCFFETRAEYYDPGEGQFFGQWFCMAETGQDSPEYEDDAVDGSICYTEEESLRDGELGEDLPGFLEGRALLQGVPERSRCVGLSGLVQAEIDVASRLRDHWRPLRL